MQLQAWDDTAAVNFDQQLWAEQELRATIGVAAEPEPTRP